MSALANTSINGCVIIEVIELQAASRLYQRYFPVLQTTKWIECFELGFEELVKLRLQIYQHCIKKAPWKSRQNTNSKALEEKGRRHFFFQCCNCSFAYNWYFIMDVEQTFQNWQQRMETCWDDEIVVLLKCEVKCFSYLCSSCRGFNWKQGLEWKPSNNKNNLKMGA